MTLPNTITAASLRLGQELPSALQVARNSSSASENKIHEDAVARQYGFSGGLVPGDTSYAYLASWLARTLGPAWTADGAAAISLIRPVYEGETVSLGGRITSATGDAESGQVDLECWVDGPDGVRRAPATAALRWGDAPPATARPPLSQTALPPRRPEERGRITAATAPVGVPLPPVEIDTDLEARATYLSQIDCDDPLFHRASPYGGPLVHPGWYPGMANRVLSANYVLNAWIHTRSEIRHLAPALAGGTYRAFGEIVAAFEKRGHEYVTVDVLIADAAGQPVARILHTAIVVVAPKST